MSSARAAAAGVGEDQAWSSEALCRSRQAPDALTYISLSQTGREMEREEERERQRERERERERERGMGLGWGVRGERESEREDD